MKPLMFSVGTSVILGVFAAFFLIRREASPSLNEANQVLSKEQNIPLALESAPRKASDFSHSTSDLKSSSLPAPRDYKFDFSSAQDYWAFAWKILPAAQSGNADAQFYLWKAMTFCKANNSGYFEEDGHKIGMDEAIQRAAKYNIPVSRLQSVHDRCFQFQEKDYSSLGNASEWLSKAADAGQPGAQANLAFQKLEWQVNPDTFPVVPTEAEPRELFLKAVKSQDPEALFMMGISAPMMNEFNAESKVDYPAWLIVACERGFDCSQNADWVQNVCPPTRCDAVSPNSLIQSIAQGNWPAAQQRARVISDLLNAGKWSDLGITANN